MTAERAKRRPLAQDGVRDKAIGELAAPLGNEELKVHVVLRFRVATRSASVPERAARARRAVTSRQRGRSERRTRRVDRPSTRATLGRYRWTGRWCRCRGGERMRTERDGRVGR